MIINYLLAIISGASLTLAFAPFRFWPISFVSLISLICIFAKQQSLKNSFYVGFMFGLGFFATSVSWVFVSIYKYGGTSIILAVFITALFVIFLSIFPGINLYLLKKFKLNLPLDWRFLLAFPASWVLLEIFRGWFLTGFPWALLGYTQLNSSLKYYASLFGVYGVSFIVAFIASLSANLLFKIKHKFNNNLFVISSLILLIFAVPLLYTKNKKNYCLENNTNTVAIIQGNINPDDKFLFQDPASLIKRVSEIYVQSSEKIIADYNKLNKKIDLILWPENSMPLEVHHPAANTFLYKLHQFASANNVGLLLGVPINYEHNYNYFYNSVLGLGAAQGVYHKINLVPFGDYVPLENVLRGLINFFNLPLSSFVAGPLKQRAIKFNNYALLATVCYDIAYAENLRTRVLADNPSVIIAVSEDGWFGDSLGPSQHLDIARMRAIETGRYILRATTSGVSAVIDNYGNIVKQVPMFKRSILVSEYKNCFTQTIWNKLGNSFIIVFLLTCWLISIYKSS